MNTWLKIGPMNTLLTKPISIHPPGALAHTVAGNFGPDGKHWGFFICKLLSAKTSLAVSKTRFVKQSEKILQNSLGNIW